MPSPTTLFTSISPSLTLTKFRVTVNPNPTTNPSTDTSPLTSPAPLVERQSETNTLTSPAPSAPSIPITTLSITGNTAFATDDLERIAAIVLAGNGNAIASPETLNPFCTGDSSLDLPLPASTVSAIPLSTTLNRQVALTDLVQVADLITKCYTNAGYINSGAFIPETVRSMIDSGVPDSVTIEVKEGRLDAINVCMVRDRDYRAPDTPVTDGVEDGDRAADLSDPPGLDESTGLANDLDLTSNSTDPTCSIRRDRLVDFSLRPDYIKRRLELVSEAPFNLEQLVDAVRLLERDPLIDRITTELVPGTEFGSSDLNVTVYPADSFAMTVFTDNARSPSVGSVRAGIGFRQSNIFKGGDRFTADYTHTAGSDGGDLRYSLPINPRNGRISLGYGWSQSEVIEESVEELDITSDSRYYDLTLRQPVIETPDEELAVSVTLSRQESEGEFLEAIPFPTAGADDQGRTRISALRLGQDWTQRGPKQVFALASELTIGLDAFDSTINERRPDSRFVAWQGQAQWVRQIAEDSLVVVRGALQLADGPLVPLAQFGVGGNNTVRGYRSNTLLTDNGWLGSAEVRIPIVRLNKPDGVLHIAPFIDAGGGWNNGDSPDPDPDAIVSTGLGLILDVGDRFSARLDWGIPLTSVDNDGDSLQESGVHFSIQFSPF